VHQRELFAHPGVPATSLGALVASLAAQASTLGAPRITVEQPGKNLFFGNGVGAPGMLQVCLQCYTCSSNAAGAPGMLQACRECCRCAWNSTGTPGIRQVHLDIIATTYRSIIVKTLIFCCILIYVSMYLCIYIATHLHTVYLHWLQAVLESNWRCT